MAEHGKAVYEKTLPGASGLAFSVKNGQTVRITDLEGGQIVDFVCYNAKNLKEMLSTSRSSSMNRAELSAHALGDPKKSGTVTTGMKTEFGKGDKLYSNISNLMFTIVEETSGASDILFVQCSHQTWERRKLKTGSSTGTYDGCFDHMKHAIREWGLTEYDIPPPFNIFQEHEFDADTGLIYGHKTPSKPGDHIDLKAEMDCLVVVTTCPAKVAQRGISSSPVKIEVFET